MAISNHAIGRLYRDRGSMSKIQRLPYRRMRISLRYRTTKPNGLVSKSGLVSSKKEFWSILGTVSQTDDTEIE